MLIQLERYVAETENLETNILRLVEDEELYPLKYTSGFKNDEIAAIVLSKNRANKIFERVGWSTKKFKTEPEFLENLIKKQT